MANESDISKPLRLSNYFRCFCDELALPICEGKDMDLWTRLETTASHLRKDCSWKKIQALLEDEATSKVAVKGLLKKLFAVSQELSEMTEIPVEEVAILLLRLFIQQPVTSLLLKQIMKHVFGTFSTSVIIYRIHQIVQDIATVLPQYTLEVLQEKQKRLGYRQELFGSHIKFVPLNRNKIIYPDVSKLNDITLMDENVQNEGLLAEDLEDNAVNQIHESEQQKFSDSRSSVYQVHCQHFETAFCEEVKLYTSLKTTKGLGLIMPLSESDEAGQSAFDRKERNSIDSALFESVFDSDKNLMITLPLGFDKTNIILLAVFNLLSATSSNFSTHGHQLKVLYLVGSKEAAEQASQKLANRLESHKIVVSCYTASTHVTKANFESAQILVTTASVWRDIAHVLGNDQMLEVVRLLIIDEMNWLQESCGPALETIVTRTTGRAKHDRPVRILGFTVSLLSADCSPASFDMAKFLHVDADNTFVVGQNHATILPQVFLVKVKVKGADEYRKTVDEICCKNVDKAICHNNKVVVFVNSEADAVHTAVLIRNMTDKYLKYKLNLPNNIKNTLLKFLTECTSEECKSLCLNGFLIISSEMTANARNFISIIFRRGIAKIVVATSNFAWMLSNQGDTVIIKETGESGSFTGIGMSVLVDMLNVATSFSGKKYTKTYQRKAIILCNSRFEEYLALLQNKHFVESQLLECLPECLNTEITFSNLSTVTECEEWFRCTYLYHTMRSRATELGTDLSLAEEVQVLVSKALKVVERAGMIHFLCLGSFKRTELGHIADHLNIDHLSMEFIGNYTKRVLTVNSIIGILSKAPVFSNIQVKEVEADELRHMKDKYCNLVPLNENNEVSNMVIILLQTYLLGGKVQSSGLRRDQDFIVKKTGSLARAMFEVSLSKRNAALADRCLQVAKMVEKGVWNNCNVTSESPKVQLQVHLQPISRTVILVTVFITPAFSWKEELFGISPVLFWLWVEDSGSNFICNHESFKLTRNVVENKTCVELTLPVTTSVPLPNHFTVCIVSDKWLGAVQTCNVNLRQVSLPNDCLNITGLLKLHLLPVSVLKQEAFEQMYSFHHFSSEITQAFHSLYHTDCNVLLAASATKHRVTAAELAIFRVMSNKPGSKVVYLTSQKSEVKARLTEWQKQFKKFGWKLISLSEDISESIQTFFSADIVVTTAYRWEVTSRAREIRKSLKASKVSLIIVDELQVLDTAVEAVVSRVRAPEIRDNVRLIGLSRATLAYTNDFARFLGIPPDSPQGIYNFGYVSNSSSSSITAVEIVAFTQKRYTTRMMIMSQAVWDTLKKHLQPNKCVCVLVPTQRQVILTAQVLKTRVMNSKNPKVWLHCEVKQDTKHVICAQDLTVQDMLQHGIGILHSGMSEVDCDIVQDLATSQKIRVIVVSWDVIDDIEMKSHLLIVKGTEQYCVSMENYIDIPIREIADKIYSCSTCWTKAVIFTQESKKSLYQAYFQGALCVESHLLAVLPEYLNTEINTKTVESRKSALDHLSRSYLGHRLISNPSYYLGSMFTDESKGYQSLLVEKSLCSLEAAGCVILEDSGHLQPTLLGLLSCSMELCHNTVKYLSKSLNSCMTQQEILLLICHAQEFTKLPARVHDNQLIRELKKHSRWKLRQRNLVPVVVKVFFLLQSHFAGLGCRLSHFIGYMSDMKEVLVSAKKIIQVVVVICSDRGWLKSALWAQLLQQMLVVGSWGDGSAPLCTLPHVAQRNVKFLLSHGQKTLRCLPELQALYCKNYPTMVETLKDHFQVQEIMEVLEA
ncbi:activating signal cointegrator 1 complex subunit 3-like isoform X3 [Zootermopsis nevadensis]|uniref:activating signal cointegrator 1 complex subunit 3-like isoform X3 n=1 Tax=Zootermopsis nevadensis TaxID=136037 RepID=UPI000B8E4F61|nr:activating signal cointegrator 1 complex subunit 3-like isoform X3 [Zootermopsis nevadensis]